MDQLSIWQCDFVNRIISIVSLCFTTNITSVCMAFGPTLIFNANYHVTTWWTSAHFGEYCGLWLCLLPVIKCCSISVHCACSKHTSNGTIKIQPKKREIPISFACVCVCLCWECVLLPWMWHLTAILFHFSHVSIRHLPSNRNGWSCRQYSMAVSLSQAHIKINTTTNCIQAYFMFWDTIYSH